MTAVALPQRMRALSVAPGNKKGSVVGDDTSEPETHQPEMVVDL